MFNSEKLAEWSCGEWEGSAPAYIRGVSNNTATIKAGELYIAIRGERFDGHTFVADALKKGAAGAMVDRDSAGDFADVGPVLRVDDTVAAMGRMARGYRDEVNPVIVGVTGSVGKTTVKEILRSVMSESMLTAATLGNLNNNIGLPLSLLAMEPDSCVGVFELGMNHPGEIEPLCRILKPQWGIVTAVGPVHIEFFDSVEDIAREKGELLRSLPADGHAVLCSDDPYFEMLRGCVECRVHTVSLKGNADYVVDYDRANRLLAVFEKSSCKTLEFSWDWPGEHNALNAGYAIATARGMGLSGKDIAVGLTNYRPAAMRWEVEEWNGITLINDAYNANPLSMCASLKAFEDTEISGGRWLVLGGMMELGRSSDAEHLKLGEYVGGGDWRGVILIGEAGEKIAEGLAAAGFNAGKVFCTKNSAAAALLLNEMTVAGDGILLKASRSVALENVIKELRKTEEVA